MARVIWFYISEILANYNVHLYRQPSLACRQYLGMG